MRSIVVVVGAILSCAVSMGADAPGKLLERQDIRIRDPFIYADSKTRTYYLYAQSANRPKSGFLGVEAYTSKDLANWNPPQPVLTLPNDAGIRSVWAPEVHEHNGSFYLFVTLTFNRALAEEKPVASSDWKKLVTRGTFIYRANSPTGPFKPLKDTSHTPSDWMALDGTLFVEDGTPYMVFCHEWRQLIDGTIDVVQLKDNFSDTVGKPELLFKASDAPGARTGPEEGKVTDGCFLYRSLKSRKLFMIWSTFIPGSEYCVILTESKSGTIKGPWVNHRPIYKNDGGHGMLFRTFDGQLLMAIHQPNRGSKERLNLYRVLDDGESLEISGKFKTESP